METKQYIFNKSRLAVKFGNILESQSEVIVSSDDCYVTMGGCVSRAILKEGGLCIKSDAQKMVPVPLGDVVVTTAGSLEHQKYVYHCITIDKKRRMQILASKVMEEDVLNYLLQHSVENVIREIGYAVNMNKPILPLVLDDAPYAKSIRLDISDIDQIDFKNPMASSKKLITSLMYVLNR